MGIENLDVNVFCYDDFQEQIDIYRRVFHENPRLVWRRTALNSTHGIGILANLLPKYQRSFTKRLTEVQWGSIDLPTLIRTPEEFMRFIGTDTLYVIFDYKEYEFTDTWVPRGFCTCDIGSRQGAMYFRNIYLFEPVEHSCMLVNEIFKLCFLEVILDRTSPRFKRLFIDAPIPRDHNRTFYDLSSKAVLDLNGIGLARSIGSAFLRSEERSTQVPNPNSLRTCELTLSQLHRITDQTKQLLYQAEVFNHYDPKKLLGIAPLERNAISKRVIPEQLFYTLMNSHEHIVLLYVFRSTKMIGVLRYSDYPYKPIRVHNVYIVPSARGQSYGRWFIYEWLRTMVSRADSVPIATAWAEGTNMRYIKDWMSLSAFTPYRLRLHHEYTLKEYTY